MTFPGEWRKELPRYPLRTLRAVALLRNHCQGLRYISNIKPIWYVSDRIINRQRV